VNEREEDEMTECVIRDRNAFSANAPRVKMLLFDCDGVFTDGSIVLGTDGFECKLFHAHDGMGIDMWHRAGMLCGCITGRTSEALARRAQELRFEEIHQQVKNKRTVFEEICARRGLAPAEVAYVGDDVNDLPLLGQVGVFFSPADANPEILERTQVILTRFGGRGAVREVIDILLGVQGRLQEVVETYVG